MGDESPKDRAPRSDAATDVYAAPQSGADRDASDAARSNRKAANQGDWLSIAIRLTRKGGGFALDVAFEVPPGITVLFGPSGSGKSTILAAIAGLVRPEAGRIELGTDVWFDATTRTNKPIHERRVAFVFQSLALFPHMTAAENAAYGVSRSLPKDERRARALASLSRFHVAHLAHRKPATFSGGEAQRVALARAFAMEPRAVLLDEPFSALDFTLRQEFIGELRAAAHDLEVPILHVTHHRNEARVLGDRAVLLEHGKVRAQGEIATVLPALHRMAPGDEGGDFAFAETPMHEPP